MKTPYVKLIPQSPLRLGFLLIPLLLGCFVLSPHAQAVCQEGCDTINFNTFLGDDALLNNTTGVNNTAIGNHALLSNTTGYYNTAIGDGALGSNSVGPYNTANGFNALFSNTTGGSSTAMGSSALFSNTTGGGNTAIGADTLRVNTTGGLNTAIGELALYSNTTGSGNIALGVNAGAVLRTGSNNIYIGSRGAPSEFRTIRIGDPSTHGRTFVAGISGVTVAGGVGVMVDTNGQLGTVVSSERFKDGIKPMDRASEAILALKPVTFRYKHELDPKGVPQFGLVAEDVEKVNPDLVARDEQGKPYSVRYEAVNAMLLNEFLQEHKAFVAEQRKVQEQGATIACLEQQIETLTVGLQKVNARLEVGKPAVRTVLNDSKGNR